MITKSAQDTQKFTKQLTFTRSARSAWKLIITSVERARGHVNILLPSYIGFTEREGSGIFDPVEETKATFVFYPLNENLSIDLGLFRKMAETKTFNIALVVHYFGFCRNDMDKIKKICQDNNIILVEDCAHAFQMGLTTERLGINGDFSIYSVHKHLATDSGGVLRGVSDSVRLLPLPEEDAITPKVALQLLNTDLEGIAAIRRKNFETYKELLPSVEGIDIMYDLRNGDIPQTFPIRVKNGKREQLYFYLMEKGIPTTALYYRLIDNLDTENYPLMHEISGEILNLPVHQDTTENDIALVVKEIKNFLQGKQ